MIIAMTDGIAQTSKAASQPRFSPKAIGTLKPDAIAAKVTIAVEKTLVMNGTFVGNLSLITLGNRTFNIAMPIPAKSVPLNSKKAHDTERTRMPIVNQTRPKTVARSCVYRCANLGTSGDIKEKAIGGKLVKIPALQFDKPASSRIEPITGPTDVIAGRKLNATKTIPSTSINL